jgi:hypothetical protein
VYGFIFVGENAVRFQIAAFSRRFIKEHILFYTYRRE